LHNSNNDQKIFYAFLINKNNEIFMYQKNLDQLKKVGFVVQTTDLKDAYEEQKIVNINQASSDAFRDIQMIKDLQNDLEILEFPRSFRKDIA
jgi:DNA uptake protein ComE-like DNA-binding protein